MKELLFTFFLLFSTQFTHQLFSQMIISDFSQKPNKEQWYVVNDDVMGGVSTASLSLKDEGYLDFSGKVSLENNGGFSSIRYIFDETNVSGKKKAIIKLRGDGKRYKFRVRSDSNERFSYSYEFLTSGEWEEIIIPLDEMYPSFRGRILDLPNYPALLLSEINFLIGNKKEETFQLQIAKISLE